MPTLFCKHFIIVTISEKTSLIINVMRIQWFFFWQNKNNLNIFFFNQNENPIILLQSLFQEICSHKKKVGVINTKKIMSFVRKKNGWKWKNLFFLFWKKEMFQGDSHQDTQEFLIWLLNMIDETLQKNGKKKKGYLCLD